MISVTDDVAAIIPFPLIRRIGFIRRHAETYLNEQHDTAEKRLAFEVRRQRETLVRKGIDEAIADAQAMALEQAIRAETLRLVYGREQAG